MLDGSVEVTEFGAIISTPSITAHSTFNVRSILLKEIGVAFKQTDAKNKDPDGAPSHPPMLVRPRACPRVAPL
jgi:hypothetical protein